MKPKSIYELLVHFQEYLKLFDSNQDFETKARIYLEALNMDIGLTDMSSEFDEKPIKYEYDITPEYYFRYINDATEAELYCVNNAKAVDIVAVTASEGNFVAPHEDVVKYFRNKIDSGAYKTKIIPQQ